VRPIRTPPLLAFAAASLTLHVAAVGLVRARGAARAPTFEPSAQTLAGETLDVEPPAPDPGVDSTPAPDTPSPSPAPAPTPPAHAPAPARSPTPDLPASPASPAAPGGARPALFGAVGVRYATDLATSFTRAFPQAASADAVWSTVAFGSAGTADLSLTIDDAGHLTGHAIAGSPSPALRRGIERTLALLGPRTFTARGALTRLRVSARVGKDDVHDGLHGDVFALSGGSFSGDVGTAFFALPAAGGGRRIDVELRLLP
jgi:hypothetical protein